MTIMLYPLLVPLIDEKIWGWEFVCNEISNYMSLYTMSYFFIYLRRLNRVPVFHHHQCTKILYDAVISAASD